MRGHTAHAIAPLHPHRQPQRPRILRDSTPADASLHTEAEATHATLDRPGGAQRDQVAGLEDELREVIAQARKEVASPPNARHPRS